MGDQTDLQRLGVVEPEQRHLSFSQLSTYLDCGEKFKQRYILHAPQEPQGALMGGSAVHQAIEYSEHEGMWPHEWAFYGDAPVIDYFNQMLDNQIERSVHEEIRWGGRADKNGIRENEQWWRTNGQFMLRRYRATRISMNELGWLPFENDGTEMRVLAELPGVDLPVVGYLDKFLMQENGEPLIVDWKTGRIGSVSPFQFATYARLVKLALDIDVTRGVGVFLRAADAPRRVVPVEFGALVPRIDEMYAALADGIDREVFFPKPSMFCPSCSVRSSCWYWEGTGGDER